MHRALCRNRGRTQSGPRQPKREIVRIGIDRSALLIKCGHSDGGQRVRSGWSPGPASSSASNVTPGCQGERGDKWRRAFGGFAAPGPLLRCVADLGHDQARSDPVLGERPAGGKRTSTPVPPRPTPTGSSASVYRQLGAGPRGRRRSGVFARLGSHASHSRIGGVNTACRGWEAPSLHRRVPALPSLIAVFAPSLFQAIGGQ